MPENFVHTSYPSRVVFGAGSLEQVAAEVELLGVRRALVIATGSAHQAADVVEAALKERFAGRIDGVRQHVPTEVAEAARAIALLSGRPTVGFEDVQSVAGPVMNHRLILNYKARLDQVDTFVLVEQLVAAVDAAGLDLPADVRLQERRDD